MQPKEFPLNYIFVPNIRDKWELYYFKKLDLIVVIDDDACFFQVKNNQVIQNALTQQLEKLINNSINTNSYFRISISENKEQIFLFYDLKLFTIKQMNNRPIIMPFQEKNKFQMINQFQVNEHIISCLKDEFYMNTRYDLRKILRYKAIEEIEAIENIQGQWQIIFLDCYHWGRFIFYYQEKKVKQIRKLRKLNCSIVLGKRQILQYDKINNCYSLKDFCNMKIKLEIHQQMHNYPNYIKELDLFVIQEKNTQQIEEHMLRINGQIQIIYSNRVIKLIKFSQSKGFLIFYGDSESNEIDAGDSQDSDYMINDQDI